MRKIRVGVKVLFPNPIVYRVDHREEREMSTEIRRIKTHIYRTVQETWGFTEPEIESINEPNTDPMSIFSIGNIVYRSYWCFSNNEDALQFRLLLKDSSIRVYMWPSRLFTIHEITED